MKKNSISEAEWRELLYQDYAEVLAEDTVPVNMKTAQFLAAKTGLTREGVLRKVKRLIKGGLWVAKTYRVKRKFRLYPVCHYGPAARNKNLKP